MLNILHNSEHPRGAISADLDVILGTRDQLWLRKEIEREMELMGSQWQCSVSNSGVIIFKPGEPSGEWQSSENIPTWEGLYEALVSIITALPKWDIQLPPFEPFSEVPAPPEVIRPQSHSIWTSLASVVRGKPVRVPADPQHALKPNRESHGKAQMEKLLPTIRGQEALRFGIMETVNRALRGEE